MEEIILEEEEHLDQLLNEEESYGVYRINAPDDDIFEYNHAEENTIDMRTLKQIEKILRTLMIHLFHSR